MKKIIAIINQKGGVGKTTTSINLSCGLALEGHQVLLIDLDPQAHSTIGLGIEPGSYESAIQDIFLKKKQIEEITLKTKIKNLFLAPSHIRLDKTEQLLTSELFKEIFLYKAISNLKYDFILMDCRPTLGTLTINALYSCNLIIVPCEIGRYSLDGFADLMETIETVKNREELKKKDSIRILLNKFDSRNKISNDWFFRQLEPFNDMILKTIIRKNETINQAHMAQEPILTLSPGSKGAKDFCRLTKELLNICSR